MRAVRLHSREWSEGCRGVWESRWDLRLSSYIIVRVGRRSCVSGIALPVFGSCGRRILCMRHSKLVICTCCCLHMLHRAARERAASGPASGNGHKDKADIWEIGENLPYTS
jgi:hypothetical protein